MDVLLAVRAKKVDTRTKSIKGTFIKHVKVRGKSVQTTFLIAIITILQVHMKQVRDCIQHLIKLCKFVMYPPCIQTVTQSWLVVPLVLLNYQYNGG